jgi:hypothetical protein
MGSSLKLKFAVLPVSRTTVVVSHSYEIDVVFPGVVNDAEGKS